MLYASLIIPTYNEAKNLPHLLKEIFESINPAQIDLEVIIVDDNSPDGTAAVAHKLSSTFPVSVIKRTGKLGLGSAVIAGFAHSRRPLVGVMDADLSHPPALLPELITALKKGDLVVASRFEAGSRVMNWAWYREGISRIGVYLAQKLTHATDPLSGYFFVRRSIMENNEFTTRGYKILLEILVKAKYRTLIEIPFTFRTRLHGQSKLNSSEYLRFLRQLIEYAGYKIKVWYKERLLIKGRTIKLTRSVTK